jgi:hypothetical protein
VDRQSRGKENYVLQICAEQNEIFLIYCEKSSITVNKPFRNHLNVNNKGAKSECICNLSVSAEANPLRKLLTSKIIYCKTLNIQSICRSF